MAEDDKLLDFSKYRSREIVQHLSEILSLPGRFFSIIKTTTIVVVVAVAAAGIGAHLTESPSWVLWGGMGYGLVIGVLLGLVAAILWLIHRELGHAEGILRVLLDTSRTVVKDIHELKSDPSKRPSGGQIVRGVYDKVILPGLDEAASQQGLLSVPLKWALHSTLGRGVKMLVARVDKKAEEVGETPEKPPEVDPAEAAENTGRLFTKLAKSLEVGDAFIQKTGSVLRKLMMPLWFAFFCLCGLAVLPFVLVLHWSQ